MVDALAAPRMPSACCRCCRRASPERRCPGPRGSPAPWPSRRRSSPAGSRRAAQLRSCAGLSTGSTPGFASRPARTPAAVGMLLRVSALVLVVYGGLLLLTYWSFKTTPKGFIPTQDMGYLMVAVQLPDAASVERCRASRRPRAGDLHEHAGREAHLGHRRPSFGLERQRLELRHDVRDPRRLCPSRGARAFGRRDRRQAARSLCRRKCPRRW